MGIWRWISNLILNFIFLIVAAFIIWRFLISHEKAIVTIQEAFDMDIKEGQAQTPEGE